MSPEPFPSSPKDRTGLVVSYDDNTVYQGQRGKLPEDLRLWPANAGKITDKNWPQYYVGSYPICFRILPWNGSENSMGQAPGTHWYHSHKHGSTSVNLFNGLEGALIIEDNSATGCDGALKAYYSKQKSGQNQGGCVSSGTVQAVIDAKFKAVDDSNTATVAYPQPAPDGIQLAWKNY